MDENEFFWSSNYVDIKDLFEFYHVVKYECDRWKGCVNGGDRILLERLKDNFLLESLGML